MTLEQALIESIDMWKFLAKNENNDSDWLRKRENANKAAKLILAKLKRELKKLRK